MGAVIPLEVQGHFRNVGAEVVMLNDVRFRSAARSHLAGAVGLAFLLHVGSGKACLCERSTEEEDFARADLVAIGRPYESLSNQVFSQFDANRPETWHSRAFRFALVEVKKAPTALESGANVTLLDPAFCSLDYPIGGHVLLYATQSKDGTFFDSSLCDGTRRITSPSDDEACLKCNHPHSAKEAIAKSDAVFSGFVVSADTDSAFKSRRYHYRVFARTIWKGAHPGQMLDVYWNQVCNFQLSVGGGYRFFARKIGDQLVHDRCLEPTPPSQFKDRYERSREYARIDAQFDLSIVEEAQYTIVPPDSEFANSASGELTADIFRHQLTHSTEAPDAGAETHLSSAKIGAWTAPESRTEAPATRFPQRTPSCSRCSLTPRGRTLSLPCALIALAAITGLARQVCRSRAE